MSTKGISGITNLYLYNRYVQDVEDDNTSNINDTETLRYIIDQVNELIGKKCARNFGSATYKEWVDTGGMNYVILNNYPITNVKLVSTGSINLARISNTGNPLATVSSNGSAVILNEIATTGVETSTAFTFATYANVSSIVTAIDAIGGWTAEVEGNQDDALTQLIKPLDSGWAVDTQVELVGPYLGSNVRVEYDSDSILRLGAYDYFDSFGSYGNYACDSSRKVFVWYVAGYTLPVCNDQGSELTTDGNVPEGLTLLANKIIKDYLTQTDEDTNMSREDFDDYKYIRSGISSAVDRYWSDLCQYARKSI